MTERALRVCPLSVLPVTLIGSKHTVQVAI